MVLERAFLAVSNCKKKRRNEEKRKLAEIAGNYMILLQISSNYRYFPEINKSDNIKNIPIIFSRK